MHRIPHRDSPASPSPEWGIRLIAASVAGGLLAAAATSATSRPSGESGEDPASNAAAAVAQCDSCHLAATGLSHPTGRIPSMPVPADLPLERGRVGCTTCHAIRTVADHELAHRLHQPLLRGGDSGADLCGQCHETPSQAGRSFHTMLPGRAHLAWIDASPRAGRTSFIAEDTNCLSCHDGAVASLAGREVPGGSGIALLGNGHPVDVEYGRFSAEARYAAMHPVGRLDPRIRLFDGRVGCGSCHSVYSPHRDLLVIPNEGSTLCLACHDQ